MTASSRETWDTQLNWDMWGRAMCQIFYRVLVGDGQPVAEPR
jgi:hypothetical protein